MRTSARLVYTVYYTIIDKKTGTFQNIGKSRHCNDETGKSRKQQSILLFTPKPNAANFCPLNTHTSDTVVARRLGSVVVKASDS